MLSPLRSEGVMKEEGEVNKKDEAGVQQPGSLVVVAAGASLF